MMFRRKKIYILFLVILVMVILSNACKKGMGPNHTTVPEFVDIWTDEYGDGDEYSYSKWIEDFCVCDTYELNYHFNFYDDGLELADTGSPGFLGVVCLNFHCVYNVAKMISYNNPMGSFVDSSNIDFLRYYVWVKFDTTYSGKFTFVPIRIYCERESWRAACFDISVGGDEESQFRGIGNWQTYFFCTKICNKRRK